MTNLIRNIVINSTAGLVKIVLFVGVAIVIGILGFLFFSILGGGTISWQTLQEFFLGPLYLLNILEYRYDPTINRDEYAAFLGCIYWAVLLFGILTGFEE